MAEPVLTKEQKNKIIAEVSKELVAEGKLIEAGWAAMKVLAYSNQQEEVLEELRNAFFAGAQHLFGSVMTVLDPGKEPTDKDLERMTQIHQELEAFITDYKAKHHVMVPEGTA